MEELFEDGMLEGRARAVRVAEGGNGVVVEEAGGEGGGGGGHVVRRRFGALEELGRGEGVRREVPGMGARHLQTLSSSDL